MDKNPKKILRYATFLLILALLVSALPLSASSAKAPAPKNIIVMIADGMGFNTMLATSYYQAGKPDRLVFDNFPFKFAMSTYAGSEYLGGLPGDPCVGHGYDPAQAWSNFEYPKICYTDSASAATAMATGVKTYNAAIGVDIDGNSVPNIMEAAEAVGKSTGVITTVEFSHATPAGFSAHDLSRNNYVAIAMEMVHDSRLDVIMSAGHPWYDNSAQPKATPDFRYVGGSTTWDGLVAGTAGGDADGDGDADPWVLIQEQAEFQALGSGPTPARVIGVAKVYTTLQQSRSGDANADAFAVPFNTGVPTLKEMTQAALNVLDSDPDGLVLMIEGGAVDWAAHANTTGRLIEEMYDFQDAVGAVLDWVQANNNWGETMLVITGDHETGYLWGPGSNPDWMPLVNNGAGFMPGTQWNSPNHTNSLIAFYAKGDDARWYTDYATLDDPVRGRYLDNTSIAKVIFQLLGAP